MKPIHFVLLLCVAVLAGTGGWLAARKFPAKAPAESATGSGRKILYYQSAMHPWIKSDQPGRCTICGMELSPVFEGDKVFNATEGVITLGSNSIQVINVQSDDVRRRPLRRSMRVSGMIDDNDSTHRIVSAYVDGRIDRLAVNFVGAEVVAGQPLATFYSPMLLAAEREYASLRRPRHANGATSLTAEHARLVDAAAQRLKRLGLSDAQIEALSAKSENELHSEILAPVSGTVVARNVYEGQYVKEGEKLFEIADFSTMWFLFDAYERDLAWLKTGQKVEVTTPSAPGRTFSGTITFIDPNLREMTRSAKVRVELPNPLVETNGVKRRELFHKLYADASVQIESPDVLAVPRGAVLSPGAVPVVYVDKGGGGYEQRKLRLGRRGDEDYEVLDGLAAGERVVTQGNMLIDAQAQLNSSAGPLTPSEGERVPLPSLTEAQRKAAQDFIRLADALTAALAADNLTDFNAQAQKTHAAVPALVSAFPADDGWRAIVSRIEAAGHLGSAGELKAARKGFHPLSEATVEFTKALRRQDDAFKALKVFRCPMTKDSFPNAPRTAEWIQMQPEVRNPYFGAEMLDCGSEVKP